MQLQMMQAGSSGVPVNRQALLPVRIQGVARAGLLRPTNNTPTARGLARDILTSQAQHIEGDPLSFLEVTEAYWKVLKNSKHEPEKKGPTVVRVNPNAELGTPDFDVMVCGGTLGLMLATTLQRRGHKVAVVDKRLIQGRTQEWNISRGEIEALVAAGLLTPEELESCIVSEFNPVRVGFAGGPQLWVNDCLNLGVSPRKLLDLIKAKFVEAGGVLLENHSFRAAEVVPGQGVRVTLAVHPAGTQGAALGVGDVNRPNGLGGNSSNLAPPFTSVESTGYTPQPARGGRRKMEVGVRLLLDCMGHYSDIVKQMRGRAKPDGMCLVVGGCAEGFPNNQNNTFADLLYTMDGARDDLQTLWEAFPAEGGSARTTYMFAYSDAEPSRPSFEQLLDRYFEGLQQYQGVPAEQLKFKRVLFGGFPCWSNGPLAPQWDHIIQVGDASATQSPLSFGGFGAMVRHLRRLTEGIDDALRCGALTRQELAWMHPYQPSLSASWLFQRAMSVGAGQLYNANKQDGLDSPRANQAAPSLVQLPRNHVNEVLGTNFKVMNYLGDRVLRPFLQDTIQLGPLSITMTGMMLANPIAISRVLLQVGPKNVGMWFLHYFALLAYTALHHITAPVRAAIKANAASSLNDPAAIPVQITASDGKSYAHPQLKHSTDLGRSRAGFWLRRMFDALEYGSSSDYQYHAPMSQPLVPAHTMFDVPEPAMQQREGQRAEQGVFGQSLEGGAVPVPVVVPVTSATQRMQ